MMVQALVAQIRPLRLAIENYDQEIERVFQQHPDRVVFESFPGAGKVLAPRLLAAFGANRDRFQTALEVQEFSGIAPVTERSGKAIWVHRRLACPKFISKRSMSLPTAHGGSAPGPNFTIGSSARGARIITPPSVLSPTNGFALCSGAGRIARLTTTAST